MQSDSLPYPAGQPGLYPNVQPEPLLPGQPGPYPQDQQGPYPGQPQPYPQGQPGPYPPGPYPQGEPGPYPQVQPYPGQPGVAPVAYPPNQPSPYPQGQPTAYPPTQAGGYVPGQTQPIPEAVMTQPAMSAAPGPLVPQGPSGLQYLALLDQVLIKQKKEILEAITGFETENKYNILNSLGQQVYAAQEKSDCCSRQCCGPSRSFEMEIVDTQGQEVISLVRPLRCQGCCCFCCLQEMEVHSPPGTLIGKIEQQWSIFTPTFLIKDAVGTPVLKIEGPWCACKCNCFGDIDFKIFPAEGDNEVGKISKQWTGLAAEMFTDADNFGVNFPLDLDVKMKASLIGATFLIDFMYFETSQQNNDH